MERVILGGLYNDWESADELFRAVGRLLPPQPCRLLLVDDGSLETKPDLFLAGETAFSAIQIIRLRRNVGHQRAIAIGLSYIAESCPCETVAIMDCDGEDRPEDLIRLWQAASTLAAPKIVFAERTRRSESLSFRSLYLVYRALHLALTGYRIRFGNFSVVPQSFLGRLVIDPNLWLHFAATVVAGHVPFTTIPTQRGDRLHGRSKLNLVALVIHGLAAISCYNEVVGVRLVFCAVSFGFLITVLLTCVLGIHLMTNWGLPGWATYTSGLLLILLVQVFLIVLAFVAMAISSRKAHFFFPLQQYKFFIDHVETLA